MWSKQWGTLYFLYKNKVTNIEFVVFFRISIGLLFLIHFISYWADFELLFSNKAIIKKDIQNLNNIPLNFENIIIYFFQNLGFELRKSILFFKLIIVFLTLSIILGFYSRINSLILLLLHASFIKTHSFLIYGVDYFTSMSLFYIMIFPSDINYSLRNLFTNYREKNIFYITITKKFFQIHLCIIYFFSGLDKALGFNWWNGEAIWKAINLPNFYNDFNINLTTLANYPLIFILIGILTIIIEILYPIFINLKITKNIWLLLTILMHFGILFILNLYFFSIIMIIWNITAFYFKNNKL